MFAIWRQFAQIGRYIGTAAEKDTGMKLRMLVRLLPGMSFSHIGEIWPRGRRVDSWNRAPYGGICVLFANAVVYLLGTVGRKMNQMSRFVG